MRPTLRKSVFFPFFENDFFGKDALANACHYENTVGVPAVNIIENKDNFKLEVAAPGLAKEDFKLNLENSTLTISSHKETNNEVNEEHFVRKEFSNFTFSRSFQLPHTVDQDKIEASHKNGVLTILIPKKEEAKVKEARTLVVN